MVVNYSISACLIRVAIGAAAIAIYDVTIIADFTWLDNTVSAAANGDAYRLVGSTDLPCRAI
jgi:hypothetical protein